MTKVIAGLFMLAMIVQIIRPIGIVGLRRRSDFWKLAAIALVLTFAVAVLKQE